MSDAISVSAPISGTDRTLSFEAGKLAQLADGAVRRPDRRHRVCWPRPPRPDPSGRGPTSSPSPSTSRSGPTPPARSPARSSAGRARASDQAILTCRLIDRPLRPSFPEGFRNEVHVVGTIFGADQVNPHDVLAINAASAALMLSGIPFEGPIGAVRVAYSTDGHVDPAPHLPRGRRVDLRAGRGRPCADRRPPTPTSPS